MYVCNIYIYIYLIINVQICIYTCVCEYEYKWAIGLVLQTLSVPGECSTAISHAVLPAATSCAKRRCLSPCPRPWPAGGTCWLPGKHVNTRPPKPVLVIWNDLPFHSIPFSCLRPSLDPQIRPQFPIQLGQAKALPSVVVRCVEHRNGLLDSTSRSMDHASLTKSFERYQICSIQICKLIFIYIQILLHIYIYI